MSSMTLSIVDSQPCKLSKRYCKRKKSGYNMTINKDTVQKQYEEKRRGNIVGYTINIINSQIEDDLFLECI